MKKGTIILIAVIAVVAILVISVIGSYNGFVDRQENVEEKYSTIDVYLQRRADLIPNLVETVKGYTDYEQSTLTAVTEARNAFNNAGSTNEKVEASNRLDTALDIWVNAVTEAYPELKANEQFVGLQDELAGSENRIATARKDYNEAARQYNTKIRKFPGSLLAGIFGFDAYNYFEASDGAENAPQVSFQ